MSNRPKILFEFARHDASYIMDLLHNDWANKVAQYAVASTQKPEPHFQHIREYLKRRPSILMNYMDETAYKQGFWEDNTGL